MLLLLTVLAYLPALRAGWIWDDDYYVTENRNLRSVAGLLDLWTRLGAVPQYYPLTHTTFWIEYRLWGLWPAGYHAVNILLHATSAILLWLILKRLAVPGAWLVAAVFALHPVHVESVVWVTERKNVLSGVFYLSALLLYLPLAGLATPSAAIRRRRLRHTMVLLLFIAALLSKSITASLPAAILVIVWWKRGGITWSDVRPLLPMFVLGLAMGTLTSHVERVYVGARGAEWDLSPLERVLIAGRAVWFYAWKLIAPVDLTFIYPRWEIDPRSAVQWLFPLAALALLAAAWALRRRIGRGPLAALLLFGGTLLPALGFVNVYPMRYSFVADHFQYLASIALIALIVAAIGRVRAYIVPGVLVVLAVLTFRQCFMYRDLRALWEATIDRNPAAWMARTNLARVHIDDGKLDAAEALLRESVVLHPSAEALMNLGVIAERRGDADAALARHREALALAPDNAVAMTHVGRLLAARGEAEEALALLERAADAFPPHALAHRELGVLLRTLGDVDEAIVQLRRAVEVDPAMAAAHNDLGIALAMKQDYAAAAGAFRAAGQAAPDFAEAFNNLGAALENQGDTGGAAAAYQRALSIRADFDVARRNLERVRGGGETN